MTDLLVVHDRAGCCDVVNGVDDNDDDVCGGDSIICFNWWANDAAGCCDSDVVGGIKCWLDGDDASSSFNWWTKDVVACGDDVVESWFEAEDRTWAVLFPFREFVVDWLSVIWIIY